MSDNGTVGQSDNRTLREGAEAQSETPRTDRVANNFFAPHGIAHMVSTDFARTLERELNDAILREAHEKHDRFCAERDFKELEVENLRLIRALENIANCQSVHGEVTFNWGYNSDAYMAAARDALAGGLGVPPRIFAIKVPEVGK